MELNYFNKVRILDGGMGQELLSNGLIAKGTLSLQCLPPEFEDILYSFPFISIKVFILKSFIESFDFIE